MNRIKIALLIPFFYIQTSRPSGYYSDTESEHTNRNISRSFFNKKKTFDQKVTQEQQLSLLTKNVSDLSENLKHLSATVNSTSSSIETLSAKVASLEQEKYTSQPKEYFLKKKSSDSQEKETFSLSKKSLFFITTLTFFSLGSLYYFKKKNSRI